MKRFDCLAPDCPLFGPHLLEASAGTGKTFAIEHIYVRHILEGLQVEELLVITFTRAAARELKLRIRSALQSAETAPYWSHYPKSSLVQEALYHFDRCQVFTIHSFCYRMLKEFAFQADVGFAPEAEADGEERKLKQAALDFLRNAVSEKVLCNEQLSILLNRFASTEAIAEELSKLKSYAPMDTYEEMQAKCKAALHVSEKDECKSALHLDEALLLEDYLALEPWHLKAKKKGDMLKQVKACAHLPDSLGVFLGEKGSLFKFLSDENRKQKFTMPSLHYPGIFKELQRIVEPFLDSDPFAVLQKAFEPIAAKVMEEEEIFSNDEVIRRMAKAMQKEAFVEAVQNKYRSAMIDEFQDTDAVQWDIFQKLFIHEKMKSSYLVGDPKQSIYRFRKADVYTYLQAKEALGEEHFYQLDTNYRSSPELIGALNALFQRNWLHLPKIGKTLEFLPVKAGASSFAGYHDGKGALHVMQAEGEPAKLFREQFLPYIAGEIQRLGSQSYAVLVRRNEEAAVAVQFLRSVGIEAVAKSAVPLGQTPEFRLVCDLLDAVRYPRDAHRFKVAQAGPFKIEDPHALHELLKTSGMAAFAKEVIPPHSASQILQIFEHLFAWESRAGFSFEGLAQYLKVFRKMEEEAVSRVDTNSQAVQVMTMHVSKGLEFDVVFALGLMSRRKRVDIDEEDKAEQLRLLYVAMTRPKKRLYIPYVGSDKKSSAMDLFASCFEGSFEEELVRLGSCVSLTVEKIGVCELKKGTLQSLEKREPPKARGFTPRYLLSFTGMAKPKIETALMQVEYGEEISLQSMPKGTGTGVILHALMEAIFSAERPIWQEVETLDPIIEAFLVNTALKRWTKPIQSMVKNILSMPLAPGFSLSEVERFRPEMEFLYKEGDNFVKGFIDLVFCHGEKIYLLDWKSNWLKEYTQSSLEKAMQEHDYGLQARLYAKALSAHAKSLSYGGAFYVFLRGEAAVFV